MAGCQTHRKRFSAFLDGELAVRKRAALEEHLASCAACRGQWTAMQGLGPVLERLTVPAPPSGLAERITAEARRRQSERGYRRPVQRWPAAIPFWPWELKALGAAAVLVLMLCLGQLVGTRGWLWGPTGDRPAIVTTTAKVTEGLEWFAPGPPGSLLSGYLAMAGPHAPASELRP